MTKYITQNIKDFINTTNANNTLSIIMLIMDLKYFQNGWEVKIHL